MDNTNKQKGIIYTKKGLLRAIWVIVAVCLYPCAFMYIQNFTETTLDKILLPFAMFIFVAIIAYCISLIIFRNADKATAFTGLFMVLFINHNIIGELFARYTSLPEIVFTILVGAIIVGIGVLLFVTKKELDSVCFVIGIVYSGLIIMNMVMAIPAFVDSNKKNEEIKVEQYAKTDDFRENIYYIIMDEYGGKENLEYYFDFDNSEFLDYLGDKGFSISNSTHNYEGINTYEILPNLLNLDYVVSADNTTASGYKKLLNPAMFRFFKEAGYKIQMLNHLQGLRADGCEVLYETPKIGTVIHDIDFYLLKNSLLYYIISNEDLFTGKNETKREEDVFNNYRDQFSKIMDLLLEQSIIKKEVPTFTICYLSCPHVPFVFRADGQAADPEVAYDSSAKDAYVEQLEYLNKRLVKIIDSITENDPNAVIVLQGDHGARVGYHLMYQYKKSEYDEKMESEMMENPFNCVYWGSAKKEEIEGLSGVNTWRTILNNLYGTNYKMIETPEKFIYKWRYEDGQR